MPAFRCMAIAAVVAKLPGMWIILGVTCIAGLRQPFIDSIDSILKMTVIARHLSVFAFERKST